MGLYVYRCGCGEEFEAIKQVSKRYEAQSPVCGAAGKESLRILIKSGNLVIYHSFPNKNFDHIRIPRHKASEVERERIDLDGSHR